MKISAIITLKKDVLDPQGKVIHQAGWNGFQNIDEVRQGKYFEIDVNEKDPKAQEIVEDMCKNSQQILLSKIIKLLEHNN